MNNNLYQQLSLHNNKKKARFLFDKNNQLDTLYLVLAQTCNLRCKYCFISSSISSKGGSAFISENTIKKGIDFWIRLLPKDSLQQELYIILYGGEPLLNISGFKYAVEYIRRIQHKTKLRHSIVHILLDTNGLLFSRKLAQFCKKYDVEVTISLDGPRHINDTYRVYKNGKGTFLQVISKIKMLQEMGVSVYMATTIIPELLDYNIDSLVQFIQRLGIKYIGFNKVRGEALLTSIKEKNINTYLQRSDEFLINFWKQAKKYKIYEYRVGSILDSFRNKHFYHLKCGMFGSHIVLWPTGEIGFCPWSLKYKREKAYNKTKIKIARRKLIKKYKELIPLYNTKCLNCRAIHICEGMCPLNLFLSGFSKKSLYKNCDFYKKILKNVILPYEKKSK